MEVDYARAIEKHESKSRKKHNEFSFWKAGESSAPLGHS